MQVDASKHAVTSPNWERYIRRLDRDARDVDDKLLKEGTNVLFNPAYPSVLREDSPSNRQEFIRLDMTWAPSARRDVWFPPISTAVAALADGPGRCRLAKNRFLAAVDENIRLIKGGAMPQVGALPFWRSLLLLEPRIRQADEVADLAEQLTARIAEGSNAPEELNWPDEWRQWLASMNGLTVYALRRRGQTVHVISAVPAQVQFSGPGQPVLVSPDHESFDLIRDVYRRWLGSSGEKPSFVFYTLGSALPWAGDMTGHSAGDHWLVVSSLREDGRWQTSVPPRFADRLSLRNFMDVLRPETRQERISRIKHYVDDLLVSGYEGNIYLEKIREATGYRRTTIQDALLSIQGSGHYRLYRLDGDVAVGPESSKRGVRLTPRSFRHGLRKGVSGLFTSAVNVGVWVIVAALMGETRWLWMLTAALPLAVIAEHINKRFQMWREDKE